jgi:hypothetical protein
MGQQRRSTVAEVASTVITAEINRARHHRIDPEYPSIATPFTCAGNTEVDGGKCDRSPRARGQVIVEPRTNGVMIFSSPAVGISVRRGNPLPNGWLTMFR